MYYHSEVFFPEFTAFSEMLTTHQALVNTWQILPSQ